MINKTENNPNTRRKLPAVQKRTILVIEDEKPLLEAINAKLEKNGFSVITARSVEQAFNAKLEKNGLGPITVRSIKEALDHLESLERVDLIWLDHHLLGKEDGLDFVKKFKANGGRWSAVPIFIVSNAASPQTVKSYINSGVSKYYVKSDHRLDQIIGDIESFLDYQ